MFTTFQSALASAKGQVIASGRSNVFAYVCRDRDEIGRNGFEVLSDAWYQEYPRAEERCVAAVWSYPDGRYDDANVFHENGKIAAAVETE